MKTKIQQADDYSLHIQLDHVEASKGVRVQLLTYQETSRTPNEPRRQIDLHMSQKEFALLCQAVNTFAIST
jgi:hypothetical protein